MTTITTPFSGGCPLQREFATNPQQNRFMMLHCHCRDCQQSSGGPFFVFRHRADGSFQALARPHYASMPRPSEMGGQDPFGAFCPDCGSPDCGQSPTRSPPILFANQKLRAWMIRVWFNPQVDVWTSDAGHPWDQNESPRCQSFEKYPPVLRFSKTRFHRDYAARLSLRLGAVGPNLFGMPLREGHGAFGSREQKRSIKLYSEKCGKIVTLPLEFYEKAAQGQNPTVHRQSGKQSGHCGRRTTMKFRARIYPRHGIHDSTPGKQAGLERIGKLLLKPWPETSILLRSDAESEGRSGGRGFRLPLLVISRGSPQFVRRTRNDFLIVTAARNRRTERVEDQRQSSVGLAGP